MDMIDAGRRLVDELGRHQFEVATAFWAKPVEDGRWFLYLASPTVEDKGGTFAYRIVHPLIRQMPELGLDPLDVRVLSPDDSLAEAAEAVVASKVPAGPFGVRHKPYPGMTHFGGGTLSDLAIEGGAYIYPPRASVPST